VRKRKGKPNLANCSPNDVFRALKKLGGFVFKEGKRHTKVCHTLSGKASIIPRHSPVNRHLMRDFVEDFLVKELNYSEENIFKHLWC